MTRFKLLMLMLLSMLPSVKGMHYPPYPPISMPPTAEVKFELIDLEEGEKSLAYRELGGNNYLVHIVNKDGLETKEDQPPLLTGPKAGFFVTQLRDTSYQKAIDACAKGIQLLEKAKEAVAGRLMITCNDQGHKLANLLTETHDKVPETKIGNRFKDIETSLEELGLHLRGEGKEADLYFVYGMGCGRGPNKWDTEELDAAQEQDPEFGQKTPVLDKVLEWAEKVNRSAGRQLIRSLTFFNGSSPGALKGVRDSDVPKFQPHEKVYITKMKEAKTDVEKAANAVEEFKAAVAAGAANDSLEGHHQSLHPSD